MKKLAVSGFRRMQVSAMIRVMINSKSFGLGLFMVIEWRAYGL